MKLAITRASIILACAGLFAGTTAFKGNGSTKTITLVNKCKFEVHQIFLSPVSEDTWGDDILDKEEVLKPGESVDIEIDCGEWDAKLVASDGSVCVDRDVKICEADTWEITPEC
jgi:hypothetical protein